MIELISIASFKIGGVLSGFPSFLPPSSTHLPAYVSIYCQLTTRKLLNTRAEFSLLLFVFRFVGYLLIVTSHWDLIVEFVFNEKINFLMRVIIL